jgi:hypothetical protein
MESRLGADFSSVRVHTDAAAQRSAAGLGAHAYTSGEHIIMGPGVPARHTLAHELAHVIQQRTGPVAGTDLGFGLRVSDPSDRFERQAEAVAQRLLTGGSAESLLEPGGSGRRGAQGRIPGGADPHHLSVQRMGKKKKKEKGGQEQRDRPPQTDESGRARGGTPDTKEVQQTAPTLGHSATRRAKKAARKPTAPSATETGPLPAKTLFSVLNVPPDNILRFLDAKDLDSLEQVSEEMKGRLPSKPDYFSAIADVEKKEVQIAITYDPNFAAEFKWSYDYISDRKESLEIWLDRIEMEIEQKPSSGGGGGSWSASRVRNEARAIRDQHSKFLNGDYTIHHKISRNHLSTLFDRMEKAKSDPGVQKLYIFLDEIKSLVGVDSDWRALLNMPANLEVGPSTSQRTGDPGSGTDVNTRLKPGGLERTVTERSLTLLQADQLILAGSNGNTDFSKIADRFLTAHKVHMKMVEKGRILTDPVIDQWSKGKRGKFIRY